MQNWVWDGYRWVVAPYVTLYTHQALVLPETIQYLGATYKLVSQEEVEKAELKRLQEKYKTESKKSKA